MNRAVTVVSCCLVAVMTSAIAACGRVPDSGISTTPSPDVSVPSSPTTSPTAVSSGCVPTARPAVSEPTVAYLVSSGQLVLFGGRNPSNDPVATTWQWSNGCWTQLSPTPSPSARSRMVATYDPTRQSIVAFGGDSRQAGDSALTFDSDTWTWNGSSWVLASSSGPSLIAPSIAFDPVSGHVILTGANGQTDAVNETWSWTGSSWQQLHPASSPPARIQSAIAENPTGDQLVLFGGLQTNSILGDTWIWDGTTWDQKSVGGPSPRADAAMAFDRQSGVVLLFGGQGGAGPKTDSWAWNGSQWSQLTPASAAPSFSAAVEGQSHVLLANGAGNLSMWTGQDWQAQ